jgi:hypothetical protein
MGRTRSTHGEKRNTCTILVGKLKKKGRNPLGKPGRWWDIEINLGYDGDGRNWIHLAQVTELLWPR